MQFSSISLKRLGVCFGALLFLSIYAIIATQMRLNLYLPIGLLLMSAYVWLVVKKFKNIYPLPTKAFGQLCLTFLIFGLSNSMQFNQMMKSIEATGEGVFDAAIYHAQGTISSQMGVALFILYVVLKIKERRISKSQSLDR